MLELQTGRKPIVHPEEEPLTMVVNGQVDEKNFQVKGVDQYSDKAARFNELIVKMEGKTGERTCPLVNAGLVERYGAAGGFVDGKAIICGGYKLEDKEYQKKCQWLPNPDKFWKDTGDLNTSRAFSSSFLIPDGSLKGLYIAGGYSSESGFMDTVEKFDPVAKTWSIKDSFKLPTKKSHFCTVYYKVNEISEAQHTVPVIYSSFFSTLWWRPLNGPLMEDAVDALKSIAWLKNLHFALSMVKDNLRHFAALLKADVVFLHHKSLLRP